MRILSIAAFAVGCTHGLREETFPTGSQTAVGAPEHDAVYLVDVDQRALQRVGTRSGAVTSVDLDAEPARVARAGDRVWVTLRDTRSVAVLRERGGSLELEETVEVGAEPVGIVAREDGEAVYVALSTSDLVLELDGATLAEKRRFAVGGQPTWLALHPEGRSLYVASALGSDLHWVDLDLGTVTAVGLPELLGAGQEGQAAFARRATGDPWASADGRLLAVPVLYADTSREVADPLSDDGDLDFGEGDSGFGGGSSGYGSAGLELSRFNPGVVLVPTRPGPGTPDAFDLSVVFVAGFLETDDRSEVVRSYLSSVAVAPAGDVLYATMEASGTVVALSTTPVYLDADCRSCDREFDTGGSVSLGEAGFTVAPAAFVAVAEGPRGVAFTGDNAWVHSFIDRSLQPLDPAEARALVRRAAELSTTSGLAYEAAAGFDLGASGLDSEVAQGRRLFFSATDRRMASSGAGVSCSTCHYQGRNDGFTWSFTDGVRQTPSLSAPVSLTAPVTWTENVPSVADEAMITSQGRMGGDGLSAFDAARIQAFVDTLRVPDGPERGREDPAIERGRILFERADTQCADCHPAPLYTDNADHDMFGVDGLNTPTLVGIAATAPYLHDGSAPSLRDLLELSRAGVMGDTSALSDAEMADLETFLRSL